MEDQFQPQKSELTNLSIKDIFFKYVRFLPLFVISVALALLAAFLYLRYATLIYQSAGTILIIDEKSAGGSNDKLEDLLTSDGKKNISNEIEVLQSRPLMERVVKGLNLNFTYYAIGNIKELNIYKRNPFTVEVFQLTDSASSFTLNISFENEHTFRINNESQLISFGRGFKNQYGVFRLVRNPKSALAKEYKVDWQPTSSAAVGLRSTLLVTPKPNTGILTLTMEGDNPHLVADVINQLIKEYRLLTVEEKNETTSRTLEFINTRLDSLEQEIDAITARKLQFKAANNMIDAEIQSSNFFSRVEEADRQMNEQRIQLNAADMIERYLRDKKFSNTPVPSSLAIADPTLNTLIAAYNVTQLDRKDLLDSKAPPGNVVVRQKEQQIEQYRKSILENLRNISSGNRAIINDLQSKNSAIQSQIRSLPVKEQKLIEIDRELQGKVVVYNSLLGKKEESAIALASRISNTKVLQNAMVDTVPVKPNRRNIQLMAVLIGLILPALFIFVIELLNDKITTRHDIEKITSSTILGEVGHSYGKETLAVTSNNRSVVAEQFRILRSNLQYVLHNIKNPVVLVTSSFSGEGKSFISTNIGAVMALAGKRTIVLEFDIRKPKILSQLNISKKPGLTNYLLGKMALDQLPVPVEGNENLFVLPCGPVPPNPAELLLDPALNDLFIYLRENFDVVIMDTAPIGMVSDAMTLSKFADCTLYIVRQGYTFKNQIGLIDEFNKQGKLPKISIILNDVKIRTGYSYYGYGRYGYGQGYSSGNGYFDEEPPPPGLLTKWFGWLDVKKWNKKTRKRTKV